LPSPENSRDNQEGGAILPRTQIEELIADIWRDVLKIDNLGIHDNFFALGGHSILAIQIISRLRDTFDKEVPLQLLFNCPTIATIADQLTSIRRENKPVSLPPILPAPREGPLPLSMNQEHIWQIEQIIPGTPFFNMPYVYQLSGDLDFDALNEALQKIVQRHEALRTVIRFMDGRPLQVIKNGADIRLGLCDLRRQSLKEKSQRAAGLILEERQSPFQLSSGPLIRMKLLRLTETVSLLTLTLHHIIGDDWSVQLFWSEFLALYGAFSHKSTIRLPDIPIQLADYAYWERQLLRDGQFKEHLAYWAGQFCNQRSAHELAKTLHSKTVISFWTFRRPFEVEDPLFAEIKARARAGGYTPFIILLAAIRTALQQVAAQDNIWIGTLVANRFCKQVERMIGHLLNTVILRIPISPEMTAKQILNLTRHTVLTAFTHQILPFEYIANAFEEQLAIERPFSLWVLLNYKRASTVYREAADSKFASFRTQQMKSDQELHPTNFDLIINLCESSDKLTGMVIFKSHVFDEHRIGKVIETITDILKFFVNASREHYAWGSR
jgi:acyl carrier protein